MRNQHESRHLRRMGWLALGTIAVLASPAHAFYWLGMPGSGVTQPPSLARPLNDPTTSPTSVITGTQPTTPTTSPPWITTPTTHTNPTTPIDPPKDVPEPAGIIFGLSGVSTMMGFRWFRRRSRQQAQA